MLSVKSTFLNFQTFSVNLIIIIIIIIITIIKIIKALFKTERPISEVREEDAGINR